MFSLQRLLPLPHLAPYPRQVRAIAHSLPFPKLSEEVLVDHDYEPLKDAAVVNGYTALSVRGEKALLCLDQALTCDVLTLREGETAAGKLLTTEGKTVSTVLVSNLCRRANPAAGPNGEECLAVFVPTADAAAAHHWLQSLSGACL